MTSFRALNASVLLATVTALVGCSTGSSQHPAGTRYENDNPSDKTIVSRPFGEPDWVSITPIKVGPDDFSVVVVAFKQKLASPEKWLINYTITTADDGARVPKGDALVEASISPIFDIKISPDEIDVPKDAPFLSFIVQTKQTLPEDLCLELNIHPNTDATKNIRGKIAIDSGDGTFPACP